MQKLVQLLVPPRGISIELWAYLQMLLLPYMLTNQPVRTLEIF